MALCLRSGHCPRCHAGQGRRSVSGGQRPSHPALEVAPMGGWSTPATATSPFTVLLKPRPQRSKLLSGVPPFLSTKRRLQEQKTLGIPQLGSIRGPRHQASSLRPPVPPAFGLPPNLLFHVLGPQHFIPNAAALTPNPCPRSGFKPQVSLRAPSILGHPSPPRLGGPITL